MIPRDACSWADNSAFLGPCNLNSSAICDGSKDCICSTVSYLLAAACDACVDPPSTLKYGGQGQYAADNQCPFAPPSTVIPSPMGNLTLPSWVVAMASATPTAMTFDLAAATSIAAFISASSTFPPLPSSSGSSPTASQTGTVSSTSTLSGYNSATSSAGPASTPSPLTNPVGASSKTNSHVGAIVGGIVGAVLILALVSAGVWYTRRRRRRSHIAPSAAYKAALRAGSPMPTYQPVHHESPKNSTDELRTDRVPSPWPAVSIQSESRFHEDM
ncbi:hypothetical protein DFH07DRAFT_263526 [Mycena maculata]|uniref:Uncharacterized protein n=1 Tax=Mycena maculata TaxID=230809 RepID=A0AAD7MMI6_9AGAR|nr:hypothetical protein DFH07DRAFT_263526 [Mycena maculata]